MRINLELIRPCEVNWSIASSLWSVVANLHVEFLMSQSRMPFASFTSWELYMGGEVFYADIGYVYHPS